MPAPEIQRTPIIPGVTDLPELLRREAEIQDGDVLVFFIPLEGSSEFYTALGSTFQVCGDVRIAAQELSAKSFGRHEVKL